ncbi:ARM repeat-containing protein [Phellopilus nigrolimitatus]|nr:ARM repeat-containing protein [Phellopilus nigrolimitatus]
MGKPDIESWIASTSAPNRDLDNDGDLEESGFSWEQARGDLPAFLQRAQRRLLSSKTKERTSFLTETLLPLVKSSDLSNAEALNTFRVVILTYPRYIDQASRKAVEDVIKELVSHEDGIVEQIIGWIRTEAGRICEKGISRSSAPANRFVLLRWCCVIYTVDTKSRSTLENSKEWNALVEALAFLLDSLLDASTPTKHTLRRTAVTSTRRALRSSPDNIPLVITTTLALSKTNASNAFLIPLLCLACDVMYHLKHVRDELKQVPASMQKDILQLYTASVLMSKALVAAHVFEAFNEFIRSSVSEEDFKSSILPVMEKASLRSPEVALPVMTAFFRVYTHKIADDVFCRLVTIIMNSSKSSNPATRANAVTLLQVILQHNPDASNEEHCLNEIILPVKTSKTAGPDHRFALYSMLTSITPAPVISAVIVENTPTLLLKETSDAATARLTANTVPHLVFLLRNDTQAPAAALTVIVREMSGAKPALRRAVCALAGDVLYACAEKNTATNALEAFAEAVAPAFEANIKAVAANPLAAPAGPLEGYIALASLLGPISRYRKFEDTVSRNATVQALAGTQTKPSFLLWEKVYQKLSSAEDETWLLRALSAAFAALKSELKKNENIREHLGLAFIYLGTQSTHLDVRRQTVAVLEAENARSPQLVNLMVRDAIPVHLTRLADREKSSLSAKKQNQARSLVPILTGLEEKQRLLADLVLLTHQSDVCGTSRQLWIDLCQRAKVDPRNLIVDQKDRLTTLVLCQTLSNARDDAVTTLSFVAPDVIIPVLVTQIKDDLSPSKFASFSDEHIEIWKTPEGTLYIDVLSSNQNQTVQTKGKDAAIEKWEAELRASLASKKPTNDSTRAKALSKQDKVLVASQLRTESEVRKRVDKVYKDAKRGLDLIHSVVEARVDDLGVYFSDVVVLLLEGIVRGGAALLGKDIFDGYLGLGRFCAERLESLHTWIGVATLRCRKNELVPEELQVEPLNALVLRILYRLRSLSEQSIFDGTTFSYLSPLLTCVIQDGENLIGGGEDDDEPLERVALAINIINFHVAEFADHKFPRSQTISDLLYVIKKHPTLGKDSSSALIALGEAIHVNATLEEIDVLVKSTLASEVYVRNSALQCLQALDVTDLDWSPELWIACYDNDQQNARMARHLWEDNGLDVPESFFSDLRSFLVHEHACIRTSCASSFTEAASQWPQQVPTIVNALQNFYREKGILILRSVEATDPWPARLAIAHSFEALAPLFPEDLIESFFEFLITEEALGDTIPEVRSGMLDSASKVIDQYGMKRLPVLISMFETHLASSTPPTETADHVKEATVILLGSTARHLNTEDPRIPGVVARLVDALKTPSEQVQVAVSECLAPSRQLVEELLHELFNASKYGERRGAAYGLAGVVKGAGIAGIKEFDLIERLHSALEDKKRYEPRQGVMFALETMSATLGRNFEPYIIELLPSLLASFGDATPDVREATEDAAKVIMGNLSAYGVKRILPSLLSGLEEKQWRTKKGSIELLGTMAFCAPKQLSISLPTFLTDSHAQVRAAANRSLKQSLVPVLLKALVDPGRTPGAMTSLLKKSFVHYIDSPSLALVIPVIERGLRERGADTKRKAVQIVGNLASLTDAQDFIPYLSRLLPLVHVVLVDPVPEARATAAKALGTLIEHMVPGLLRTLKTDTSGVDRQGAAQGLSEVLAGLGMDRLEALLPDIVSNAQSPRSTVREGFMSLLVYLPATFGARFQPHLTKIVPPILSGLSDSEEYVREAAMRAGRMIISNYSNKAIDLLLPELERGMFDSSWRIRHSSITLVGELLFKVSGISGKAEIEEEEEVEVVVAESSRKALSEVLGKERRDRVLSALCIVRQDAVSIVRQSAIHIWKVLVHNTPRTVRELLPELLDQLVALLVDDESGESQETASRTIGEICKKFGERILGEILPVLRLKATSPDHHTREGVCLALCDIMENATDTQRGGHEDDIVAVVRTSLVDDEANVRAAAARAFDSLQEHLGARAIDQTIPTLLEALRQPGESSGTALQALKEVMNVRANTVFPVLIPTLVASPMTVFNARALSSLVTVAGNALSKRLTLVLGPLVTFMEGHNDEELDEALDETLKALLGSISDAEGLNTLMLLLLDWAQSGGPVRRESACKLFGIFCEESELDDSLYRVDWIRQLVRLLDDYEVNVHTAAWQALDRFVKSVPKDELEPLVVTLRRSIESTGAPGRCVPGFSLPKGVAPMVPIVIAGLTTGSNEQRENAAYAISDLVIRTEENAIKPFVVPFTGPLIRVAAQSTTYPPGVKSAILSALTTMLDRIPAFVKPFFPQLQRTFIKAASDPSSLAVRNRAGTALGMLMRSQPRVDPVVTELIAGAGGGDDSIASSHINALAHVVENAGDNVGEKARVACVELVEDAFKQIHDEHYLQAVAALFAALSLFPELLQPIVNEHLLSGTAPSVLSSHAILAVLAKSVEDDSPNATETHNLFQKLDVLSSIARKIQESIGADRPSISRPAREAKELLNAL